MLKPDKIFAQDTSLAPMVEYINGYPDSVKVNNIFIIGNEKTQKNIILRELDFTTDYYYDWNTFLEIIQADQKKIYNLRLFTSVEITPLMSGNNEVEVLIAVKERKSFDLPASWVLPEHWMCFTANHILIKNKSTGLQLK